ARCPVRRGDGGPGDHDHDRGRRPRGGGAARQLGRARCVGRPARRHPPGRPARQPTDEGRRSRL
ncbi:MAG: hypothetical protein AVDCRST_MAG20-1841, partial [uncultured Acidimicrobiales bacterium]